MSTNGYDHEAGYGNGADESDFEREGTTDDADDFDEEYLDFDDEDEEDDVGRIVPYEQLCSMLLQALSSLPIRLYHFQSMLNLNSLEREFTIICGPTTAQRQLVPQGTRVEVHMVWPAENALLSLYGSAGFCAPFHDPDEWCTHHEQQPDAFVNLTFRYYVPESSIKAISNDDDVDAIAQQLQTLIGGTHHDDIVDVTFEAHYTQGALELTAAMAGYVVTLDDELSDFDLLEHRLEELAHELSANLKKIDNAFIRK